MSPKVRKPFVRIRVSQNREHTWEFCQRERCQSRILSMVLLSILWRIPKGGFEALPYNKFLQRHHPISINSKLGALKNKQKLCKRLWPGLPQPRNKSTKALKTLSNSKLFFFRIKNPTRKYVFSCPGQFHRTRCQIWCTIELHRDPISKVLLEW